MHSLELHVFFCLVTHKLHFTPSLGITFQPHSITSGAASRIGSRAARHRRYGDCSSTMTDSQEARLLQALQPNAAAWIIVTLSMLEAQLAVLTSETASLKQQLCQQRQQHSSVRQQRWSPSICQQQRWSLSVCQQQRRPPSVRQQRRRPSAELLSPVNKATTLLPVIHSLELRVFFCLVAHKLHFAPSLCITFLPHSITPAKHCHYLQGIVTTCKALSLPPRDCHCGQGIVTTSKGLSLPLRDCHYLQGIVTTSKGLSLWPRDCHYLQGIVTASKGLALPPRDCHYLQGIVITSKGLSLLPRDCHYFQGIVIIAMGLSLPPWNCHYLGARIENKSLQSKRFTDTATPQSCWWRSKKKENKQRKGQKEKAFLVRLTIQRHVWRGSFCWSSFLVHGNWWIPSMQWLSLWFLEVLKPRVNVVNIASVLGL